MLLKHQILANSAESCHQSHYLCMGEAAFAASLLLWFLLVQTPDRFKKLSALTSHPYLTQTGDTGHQITTKDTPVHQSYQTHLTRSLYSDVKLRSPIRALFDFLEGNDFLFHFQLLAKLACSNFKTKEKPALGGLHQFPSC